MTKLDYRQIILSSFFIFAAILAYMLTPRSYMHETKKVALESMVPTHFGEWILDEKSMQNYVVSPELEETLEKFYSDTLSRVYIDKKGNRIMLSIAYGKVQSDKLRVHDPKICYSAQGFVLNNQKYSEFKINQKQLPVTQVIAKKDNRIEPITYWITVGNTVANQTTKRKIQQIKYGLSGSVPDGMLFRVSNIGDQPEDQYLIQEKFISDLYTAMKEENREIFFGNSI